MRSKNIHAVILAGGRGTRLKPYTTFVPKPLMPIGDFPIIEVILKQLKMHDIVNVTMAVGHMAQLIQAFVGDGSRFGLKIDYSAEDQPLGTAGPIGKLKRKLEQTDAFITMNGDVLTTLNYGKALDFHLNKKPHGTICLNKRRVAIDFGVITSNPDGSLKGYEEKPTLSYDVSMGVNIFSPEALKFIPENKFFNIPDLMLAMKDAGKPVLGYEEGCYWLDIGRVEDYATACEIFEQRRKEFLPNE